VAEDEKGTTRHLDDLEPKMKLEGKVVKTEIFGAFVDIGLEHPALVHISQLKRGRVNRVEDELQVDDQVEVWVRRVDAERGRVELTMIEPADLEWQDIKPSMRFEGKVTRLEGFGVFVDIGAERPGLVHISEMSSGYVTKPSDLVSVGDRVEVTVLDVDRRKRQMRLSMKETAVEPIEEYEEEEPMPEVTATAMEVALRRALEETDEEPKTEGEEPKEGKARREATADDELEDILSRTLQHRARSSSDKS
jgi:ribosomal protein S1